MPLKYDHYYSQCLFMCTGPQMMSHSNTDFFFFLNMTFAHTVCLVVFLVYSLMLWTQTYLLVSYWGKSIVSKSRPLNIMLLLLCPSVFFSKLHFIFSINKSSTTVTHTPNNYIWGYGQHCPWLIDWCYLGIFLKDMYWRWNSIHSDHSWSSMWSSLNLT